MTQPVVLGISHRTAPVSLREQISYTTSGLHEALDTIAGLDVVAEVVLLHTCNRTELYVVPSGSVALGPHLLKFLVDFHGLDAPTAGALESALYIHEGSTATWHLLRVAAGLDSMVVGEHQILGQVRDAAAEARGRGTSGRVLAGLFDAAVRTGRRARSETGISRRCASVPSAAVALARAATPAAEPAVVVVGAGKMGVLAAKNLVATGARSVIVSNRSYERALELANEWGGCAVNFERLPDVLRDADIVITSTGAPHAVLRAPLIAEAMASRQDRPLVIVDIAVPRDVEPEVADLPGVKLFDIDALEATVAENLAGRADDTPQVEAIVEEEGARYIEWLDTLEIEPTIADLHRWADQVRENEVERAMRRLGTLPERDREIVRAMSVALVGKLLHPPVSALKAHPGTPESRDAADALRRLFRLPSGSNGNTE